MANMVGQRELTLDDYISILRRRWILLAALTVVGGGLGYGIASELPKTFISETLVLVAQPTVPGEYVKSVVSTNTNQRLAGMEQQILSRTRLEPVIRQFGLYGKDVNRVPMEDLVQRLRQAIKISAIQPMAETQSQGLPGFNISVTFEDPLLAQQICSTITSLFMEENSQLRQHQAEDTTQFLAKQLDEAKTKLDEQDARLAVFKTRYLGSLPDEEQRNLNLLAGLSSQLDATTQALGRAQQDKTFSESILAQQLATAQATQTGLNPDAYVQKLSMLEEQLATLKSKYTDDHPDVIRTRNDIEALKAKKAEPEDQSSPAATGEPTTAPAETIQIQTLRAQIHQYDQVIKERTAQEEEIQHQIKLYQVRVQSSPAVEQEYKQLTRDYQTALEFYNDLLKKRDQSAMATDLERRQQGEQFQVMDPANLPSTPSFPKKANFAAGGLAS
jgi:polysaccharide chain length determinant protein (PEP-CTERM system associated)